MEGALSVIVYVVILMGVLSYLKKKGKTGLFGGKPASGNIGSSGNPQMPGNAQRAQAYRESGVAKSSGESGAMPHRHRESGVYDTYNRKSFRNDTGAMPHRHEKGHYTSMADASKLPPGYILLNGEPVRVADLEGK